MCAHLSANFEVSSIILTSFRQRVIPPPHPTPTSKETPKQPTQIRVKGDVQPDNSNVVRILFEYSSNAISHYKR